MKYLVSYSVNALGETKTDSFTYHHFGEGELNLMDPDLINAVNKIAGQSFNNQIIGIHITDICPLDR